MPTSASASAWEKTPNNMEKSRWWLYRSSRWMAWLRVSVDQQIEDDAEWVSFLPEETGAS